MTNFICLFTEKEGSTAMLQSLDLFNDVSVVHQSDGRGWEPFEHHNCGNANISVIINCMNAMFTRDSGQLKSAKGDYDKLARQSMEINIEKKAVGFKMRFRAPRNFFPKTKSITFNRAFSYISRFFFNRRFRENVTECLIENNVKVFFIVRQDVMRWALSKYIGRGDGRIGHRQFTKHRPLDTEPKLINPNRLSKIVDKCLHIHAHRKQEFKRLQSLGIDCHVLTYESFQKDKAAFYNGFLKKLHIDANVESIHKVLVGGVGPTKVHSDSLHRFVTNHEEISKKFGSFYESWDDFQ